MEYICDLVSIVIPVYNVEKYLEKSLRSVISQSYKKLEIIIVDDGSTDGSRCVCESISQEDTRIHYYYKDYGGVSSARNYGIAKATGEYLFFLDADDMLVPQAIEKLISLLVTNNCDMVVGGYQRISEDDEIIGTEENQITAILNKQGILEYFYKSDHNRVQMISVWNKLYVRNKIQNLLVFPEGKIHEDEFAAHRVWLAMDRVVLTDEVLYLYRKRTGSIMNKKMNVNRLDATDAILERVQYTMKKAPEYTGYVWRNLIDNLFTMYNNGKNTGAFKDKDFKSRYYAQLKAFKQQWKKMNKKTLSMKDRMISDVICMFPLLYMEKRRLKNS